MTQIQEKKSNEKVNSDNLPLKTEEIVSILNKTNKAEFSKDDEVLKNIKLSFKSFTLKEIAEKNHKIKLDNDNKNLNERIEKTESVSKPNTNEKEVSELTEEITEVKLPEKIYTKEESDKIANDLAKIYYQNGYNVGVKDIKGELEKGEQAIALALKNTIDNLFHITPDFLNKLNQNINSTILEICSKIVGYEIEKVPEKFIKKIFSLIESIENYSNKIKVFLNSDDHQAIKGYLEKNKPQTNIELLIDKKLQRGDLIIKSGGIEINEIVSKKINLVNNSDVESQILDLKNTNQKITSDQKNDDGQNKEEQTQKKSRSDKILSDSEKK